MATFEIHSTVLAYGDSESGATFASNNPQRRFMDWARHTVGISVEKPAIREYLAQPGETLNIFSGSRSTNIDGTSAFSILLNSVKSGTYRITHTGGTLPAFRTVRAYNPASLAHTLVINNNATLEMTTSGIFTGAVVGDIVFIPGTATGDAAGSFNPNNVGFWVVLGVASAGAKLILSRRTGESFNGVAEIVTPILSTELVIFSAAGVQVTDNLEISAGFSTVTQRAFVVSEVTNKWIEFVSTSNLPLETGITPGAAGLTFYNDCKRYVRVEVDQEAVIRLNGDTGNTIRLSPLIVGNQDYTAYFEKAWGPTWTLVIVNRSTTSPMIVTILSAE